MAGNDQARDDSDVCLFFIEARNSADINELAALAGELGRHGTVRGLSEGVICSYVAKLPGGALPLLFALEAELKRRFLFSHVESPFQEAIYHVVEDLAVVNGSHFVPVDSCIVCNALEPFPERVTVLGEDGSLKDSSSIYCGACAELIVAGRTPVPRQSPEQEPTYPTRLGCAIRVPSVQWNRILAKHPALHGREADVRLALFWPDHIRRSRKDPDVYLFYRSERQSRWLCCVVKQSGTDGFLVTAYPTDAVKAGEVIYERRTDGENPVHP